MCVCSLLMYMFQVYAVCSSVKEQCTRIPRMTGEEKEFETIERGVTLFLFVRVN